MQVIFLLFLAFCLIVLIWHLLTRRYLNPFKMTFILGKKGSGKSTLLVKTAYTYLRKGWNVYCNVRIPGTFFVSDDDLKTIGSNGFDNHSCILIDEVGLIWHSRDFKSFPAKTREWFKLQRHFKCRVFLFSQTFDIDKSLRDLTDEMFLVDNKLRVFSYAKRILRRPVLIKPSPEAPARLDDELKFDSFLFAPFGSRHFTFIPKWSKFFNSFVTPDIPPIACEYQPLNLPPKLMRRAFGRDWRKF